MRFTSQQDYNLFIHFNKELINTFIDTPIILYKLSILESKTNVYDEATKKKWYQPVQIPCLIDRQDSNAINDVQTVNVEQKVNFYFLRQECIDRNIYPEIGDVIRYDSRHFEIENTNEIQTVAGQPLYSHMINAQTHLTRITNLQLEQPNL